MIFRGAHRKSASFRQLLNYLLSDKGRGLQDGVEVITHNMKGDELNAWVKELEDNEYQGQRLRSNRIRVVHEIISFSNRDGEVVSERVMQEIAERYIELRGTDGMYVIVRHIHDGHKHLHVCASPWELEGGKSLRLSKKALLELKKELESFQKKRFPELLYSDGKHGKKQMKYMGRGGRA